MKKTTSYLKLFAIAILFMQQAFAQNFSALAIMERNDKETRSNDEQVNITMKLIDNKKRERIRQVTQVTKTDKANNRSSMIRFLSPADVKGTTFLAVEYSGRDDDQWLYLPALKKSRRISASDQTDNFVGSDFTYEDLGTEDLEAFMYKITGTEKVNGAECYVIEAIPGNDIKRKETGYSKRELWVRKDNFITTQIKYYDEKQTLVKLLKSTDIRMIAGVKWRAHEIQMENLLTGHKTFLIFQDYVINSGLQEDLFTIRNIEKGI